MTAGFFYFLNMNRPFDEAEFNRFMDDASLINDTNIVMKETVYSPFDSNLNSALKKRTYDEIVRLGWNLNRFYYLYTQCYKRSMMNPTGHLKILAAMPENDPGRARMEAHIQEQEPIFTLLQKHLDKEIPPSEQAIMATRFDEMLTLMKESAIHYIPEHLSKNHPMFQR